MFSSSNLRPETVPWRKLPKSLPACVLPEVTVTACPPLPAPLTCVHLVLAGEDWNQSVSSCSQTTYLPGSRLSAYSPSASVLVDAAAAAPASAALSVPL